MAREFGRLKTVMWRNRKFRALSDDGKMLWLYLIACPHGNALGAFVVSTGYMIDDLQWESVRLSKTISELLANGFIQRDETHDLIVIQSWWEHNTIENDNVALGAAKTFDLLPQCALLIQAFRDFSALPKALSKRFNERFPNGLPNGIETKKPEPEIEPEIQPEPQSAPSAAPAVVKVARETSSVKQNRGSRLADDWKPDEQDCEYARFFGWDDGRIEREGDEIRDWSKSSRNGVKLDWHAAWRSWVRRRNTDKPAKPSVDRAAKRRASILAGMGNELSGNVERDEQRGGVQGVERGAEDRLAGGVAENAGDDGAGRSESLRGGAGQAAGLRGDVRPADTGSDGGGGILPGEPGRPADRSAVGSDLGNDPEPQVPHASEAGRHTEPCGERVCEATDSGQPSEVRIGEIDPFAVPEFLTALESHQQLAGE